MLIEIRGAGFHNRGAQLMLWTVIDRVRDRFPDAAFCVEPINSNPWERASYRLLTVAPRMPMASVWKTKLAMRCERLISRALPASELKRYGVARRCDVTAMIDIAGYSFGDKWPATKIARVAQRVLANQRRGTPSIFMPQMFGPFDQAANRDAFQPILDDSTLIYARDKASFEWLEKLNATKREVRLAPDITIFTDPVEPDHCPEGPFGLLVPNVQMLKKSKEWESDYLNRMVTAGEQMRSRNIAPKILIHDGTNEDGELGEVIRMRLGLSDAEVFSIEDPRKIKGLVSRARLLVGSRFHAVVAALSCGTPSITLGWAHKYEMLMEDFGVGEYAHQHDQGSDGLGKAIDRLADEGTNAEIRQRLKTHKAAMRPSNEAMWESVFEAIA